MEKREKVLLVVMALAVLVGLWQFVLKGDKPQPSGTTTPAANQANGTATPAVSNEEALNAIVSSVMATASTPQLTETERQMLMRADEQWQATPFYVSRPGAMSEAENATFTPHDEEARFEVTGVLMLGEEDKVAIINGWDYREGDEILPGNPGYFVTVIAPEAVSIGRRDETSNEIVTLFTIQLEEEDPFQIRDNQQ